MTAARCCSTGSSRGQLPPNLNHKAREGALTWSRGRFNVGGSKGIPHPSGSDPQELFCRFVFAESTRVERRDRAPILTPMSSAISSHFQ
jgi:hypothetical protein